MDMVNESIDTNLAPVNAPESIPVPQERVFRQSELNEIVGRVRQEERAKQQPTQAEHRHDNSYQQPQSNQNSSERFGEHDVRRLASEEAQRLRDEWVRDAQAKSEEEHAQRIVKKFWDKVNSGKDKYDDFDKVTGNLALQRYPNVVQLLADVVDNADDVLYELGKNRSKLAQIERDSREFPEDAVHELKRFADSVKQKNQVAPVKTANQPLSQQRPSNTGTDGGNKVLSWSEVKAKYRG